MTVIVAAHVAYGDAVRIALEEMLQSHLLRDILT